MRTSASPTANAPKVATKTGILQGFRVGAVHAFLGVPYAAPPLGNLRWRAPEPVAPWSGIRQAHTHGASAWQPVAREGFGPWTSEFVVQDSVSEDCLYLNVWAPAGSADSAYPVLVWIHGGAFFQGSGSVPIYDGRALAAQGVVVVTLNYRLGVLGFLAHPDLAQDAPSTACGNFGLQDQLAALRWVRDNISCFGGNPGAVTIAGQSAGALSVHMLVASPLAQGLFQRAIAQSGPPTLVPIKSRAQAEAEGLAFAAALHQPNLQALRALSVQALAHALPPGPRFMPLVDGSLLRAWPPQCSPCDTANPNPVPMMVGQTADENSGLDPNYGSDDPSALVALLQRFSGDLASSLAAAYLQAAAGQHAAAYRDAARDQWLAALWWWADHRARSVREPTFAYLFDHSPPGTSSQHYGAFHTADVPYVLGTLDTAPQRNYTDMDRSVSALASAYWINFVKTGDPNGAGLPLWPALHPATPMLLRIGQRAAAENMLSATAWHVAHHQQSSPTLTTVLPPQ